MAVMAASVGVVPEEVILRCIAVLGEPARRYMTVREMVDAVDRANGNATALGLYRTLYGPLSNVHRLRHARWL